MMLLEKIRRRISKLLEPLAIACWLPYLRLRNRYSAAKVIAPGGPVVSLTTHGKRLNSVFYTIETIGAGTKRPSRVILWLDDANAYANLPSTLLRLKTRGLEVKITENYGPHTKYFPYLTEMTDASIPLVTADDDILYPPYWLSGLIGAYKSNDAVINCYRAHVVGLSDSSIDPYSAWQPCESTLASFQNFATGVSGVIYPPSFLNVLQETGTGFLARCPKADDVWLHVMAVRNEYPIKQIVPLPRHFYCVPDTQDIGLVNSNVFDSRNDQQIRATYSNADIELILKERRASQQGVMCPQ